MTVHVGEKIPVPYINDEAPYTNIFPQEAGPGFYNKADLADDILTEIAQQIEYDRGLPLRCAVDLNPADLMTEIAERLGLAVSE